jgi:hypothetical protein
MGEGVIMRSLKSPIIVVDKGGIDLSIYDSAEDVEQHLEAIDVRNGEYIAYDRDGRRLVLSAKEKQVYITYGEEEPHAVDLANALRAYLVATGKPAKTEIDLPALIEACR